MLQLTVNGGWPQFVEPLRKHTPFNTYGNLRGRCGPVESRGMLPSGLPAMDESLRRADYVVYSYATPIAWHVPGNGDVLVAGYEKPINVGQWVFPPFRYSVTTTKAQGRIFTALSVLQDFSG